MNPLQQLRALGQSVWLDYIRKDMLESGELARLVADGEVRGVTSNPTIFQQAIAGSDLYDDAARPLAQAGWSGAQIFEALAVQDIRAATDLLLPLYEQTGGADGFVSIEVSPRLAYDSQGTVAEARRLWSEVNRPNVMIKIPATEAGLPAIQQAVAEGINVNVTLVFSLKRYNQVMQAYLQGLEQRMQAGVSLDHVASVASFFVSRVDTLVDERLEQILRGEGPRAPRAAALLGKAAIANAKLAYAQFKAFFDGPRFALLRAHGAQLQRPLWASTSTKNPAYRDVLYVETLIGPHTVNTLPPDTLAAFRDHGVAQPSIEFGLSEARAQLDALQELGISMDQATAQLEREGVGKFADSFDGLLRTLEERGQEFRAELSVLQPAYQAAMDRLAQQRVSERLWQRDPSLWPDLAGGRAAEDETEGWLESPNTTRAALEALDPTWEAAAANGKRVVGWIGPGRQTGLEQALQALQPAEAEFTLVKLESVDPASARRFARATPAGASLFVVEQTLRPFIEVQACLEPVWKRVRRALGEGAGSSFVALAQSGSGLSDLAEEREFAGRFELPAASAGPFAALSAGGLLPARLAGVDIRSLLAGAAQMARSCGPSVDPARNPGLSLAAWLIAASSGRIEIRPDPGLQPLADWAAEALRDGLGLEAHVGPISAASAAANMRLNLNSSGPPDGRSRAGAQPTYVMGVAGGPRGLGSVVFRWQFGIACAASILRRNPYRTSVRRWAEGWLQRSLDEYRRRGELSPPPARELTGGIMVWPDKAWGKMAEDPEDPGMSGVAKAMLLALTGQRAVHLSLYPQRTRGARTQTSRILAALGSRPQMAGGSDQAAAKDERVGEGRQVTVQVVLAPRGDQEIRGLGLSYGVLNKLLAWAEFEALHAQRHAALGISLPPGVGLRPLADSLHAAARGV